MREYMLLGKNAADAGSSLYLKIEMKAADIAPQQEAFYVRATGEEYEKMREYMLLGKNAADAGSSLYLKIEMKAADIAPQQEAFYVRAEDMVIQESVREV